MVGDNTIVVELILKSSNLLLNMIKKNLLYILHNNLVCEKSPYELIYIVKLNATC